ncbi:hypothetical protein EDC02_2312 [Micromonospora sp. Llam0]|uniref:hypothetical protein n=1 Tax=Micromonospora sp. Llam0 TaxID=2485143 RepID=UPI000F461956|nr:hypothetical protein [Micromonospora sp. Llam0]ROO60440.1 hypothetical protein EDC02_2312 [Micromonospora sp. Llam0]
MHYELPDPADRNAAWVNETPAYLVWWQAWQAAGNPRGLAGRELQDLLRLYSYAVPSLEALDRLAELGALVEIGAGSGYWARLLRDRGVDVVAYDHLLPGDNGYIADAPRWSPVTTGDERAVRTHPDRTLFVCWPERPGGFLPHVLDAYEPARLALITDGRQRGDIDPLYDRLDAGWRQTAQVSIPQWPYRFDSLVIFRRR